MNKKIKPNTILLVRPQERLAKDSEICYQNGCIPIPFPSIHLEIKKESLAQLPQDMKQADAIFWVSPSAVELALPVLTDWQSYIHIAVGRATAEVLHQNGIQTVFFPEQGKDSEAVLKLNIWDKLPENGQIIVIRGENGRDFLNQSLIKKGFRVKCCDIYRRVPQNLDWHLLETQEINAVWITSSQLVEALFQTMPTHLHQRLQSVLFLTHHPRIVATLKTKGIQSIQCIENLNAFFQSESIMSEFNPSNPEKQTSVETEKTPINTTQPIVIEQKNNGGKVLAGGALVLSILALGASGFLFTQGQNVLKNQELQFKQELSQAALGESKNSLMLQSAMQKQAELNTVIDTLSQSQQKVAQKTDNLQLAYQELLRGRVDWLVDEIEVTLNLASQQLLLSGNVPVAITVLENIEQRLNRFEQAELLPIKQAISSDLAELKKRPYLNVPAVALRLHRLESSVAGLPLLLDNTLQQSTNKEKVESAYSADFWTRAWDKAIATFKGMIEVRRLDNQDAMLLAPDQIYFIRENLRLRLLNARLALMQYNGEVYQADLAAIDHTVKQYFDARSPNTQAWLQELAELKALDVRMVSDHTLSASQNAIRAYQNNVRTALPIQLNSINETSSEVASAPVSSSAKASEEQAASQVDNTTNKKGGKPL